MEYIILSFAVFGLTEAIVRTEGPFQLFEKLRHRFEKPFMCSTCTAFWIAMPLALVMAPDWQTWLMYGLGSAGAAIFLDYIADM